MEINSFWLFYIENDSIIVALINWGNDRFYIAAIGPRVSFDLDDFQSIANATDQSLSSAAISADITPEQEPLFVGLVIPSSWVGEDGKISKPKSDDIIVPLLKKLDLKPSGFVSNDEAIIEESSRPDDFPASFISLYLESNAFELSLIYLGKIKSRVRKTFDSNFTAKLVEETLVELNSDSALPPQIYVYGKADESTVEELKNFPWVGKKNVETFLHFPDVKLYQDNDLINIFFKAITSQMIGGGVISHQTIPPATNLDSEEDNTLEADHADIVPTESTEEKINEPNPIEPDEMTNPLEEVPCQELGFSQPEPINLITPTSPAFNQDINNKPQPSHSSKFHFPELKFPHLPKFKFHPFLLLFPIAFVIIFLIFFFKATITLSITPYEFNKTVDVTLDTDASQVSDSVIPVEFKTAEVEASVTVSTTGYETVGTKAVGEITIFNKSEENQTFDKGTILIDSEGHTFELLTSVNVAAGVVDYDNGTMEFGQTKTSVTATDIGPEFNISKDSSLSLKESLSASVIIKATADFTGGSKSQIQTVSQTDQNQAESLLQEELLKVADQDINDELQNSGSLIQESIQIENQDTEFSREIGEESDELSAIANADVSVFFVSDEIKKQILEQFLASETGFSESEIDIDSFQFSFQIDELEPDQASASLNIIGSSLPKIDTDSLKNKIFGKTIKNTQNIISQEIPRVYDFSFNITPKFLNILPFNPKNIDIETEN